MTLKVTIDLSRADIEALLQRAVELGLIRTKAGFLHKGDVEKFADLLNREAIPEIVLKKLKECMGPPHT